MLQQIKKPVALICALFLCVSMFTGIVLPEIAETATAVADPYADAHAKTTVMTVTDGTVTPTGTTTPVAVPAEYEGMDIYEPTDNRLFFYNSAWTTPAAAGVSAAGDYFIARYGDGVEWGNGKVYLMQYGVTAWGGADYSGSYAYDEMRYKIQQITPTVGGDNNYYFIFFPGTYGNTNEGAGKGNVFTAPDAADPAAADMINLHYYGPQAGKNPVTAVGNTQVANNRSVDTAREMVTTGTFWTGINTVTTIDGFATTCSQYYLAGSAGSHSALYLKNIYAQYSGNYYPFRCTKCEQNAAKIVSVEDSFFKYTGSQRGDAADDIFVTKFTLDNVVFDGLSGSRFNICPMLKSTANSAFVGADGKFEANITNCTLNEWDSIYAFRFYANYGSEYVDGSASINFTNNHIYNFGRAGSNSQIFQICNTANATTNEETGVTTPAVVNPFITTITDNYFEIASDVTDTASGVMFYSSPNPAGGQSVSIHDNIFKGDPSTGKLCDMYSSAMLIDVSGNLFLDMDDNVRVPRASWVSAGLTVNFKVLSDIYASEAMSGGINELFTVSHTSQDLFVSNCFIQTVIDSEATYYSEFGTDILGTITIMPKNGVTYSTKDLFQYANQNVSLIGVFSDAACTKPVSSIKKGFSSSGPLYAKAEYETDVNKATIVYAVYEPTTYRIVGAAGTTSYTFNGTTYTADNATFYTTLEAAYNAAKYPSFGKANIAETDTDSSPAYGTDVIVLTPGSYTTDLTINKSVAIVGPMLGVSPSDGETITVQNGRSTEATKEAVINATLTVNVDNNPYVALGGFASSHNANIITYTGTSKLLQRTAMLKLQDLYLATTAGNTINIGAKLDVDTTKPWETAEQGAAHYNAMFSMDNCYHSSTADATPFGTVVTNMLSVRNSTIYTPKRTGSIIYMVPILPAFFGCVPASAELIVENSCIQRETKAKADTYGITMRTSYWSYAAYNTELGFYPDQGEGLADGANIRFNNNTYIDKATGGTLLFRLMFAESGGSFEFTHNTLNTAALSSIALVDSYNAAGVSEQPIDTKIEKNVVVNRSKPWNFGKISNAANVDENFYGDPDSNVIEMTPTTYVKKDTSWYYVNEACTVKTTDIALVQCGFNGVTIVNGINEYEAKLYATVGQSYGIKKFAAFNAEVVGIYSDPAAEKALSSVTFDGTEQVIYVRVAKDNYIATWKVTLCVTDAWTDAGLTLQDGDNGYVDLSTTDKYATRTGGNAQKFAFIAADWKTFAYTDAALTTLVSADESKLEEGVSGTDWDDTNNNGVNDPRELKIGTVFYAKMPTTGIIYKLQYGVTAFNMRHCNTANFATIVLFPGYYNKATGYNSSGSATDYSDSSISSSYFAVGRDMTGVKEATTVRVLGPQAGLNAANVATGGYTRNINNHSKTDYTAEATFATNGSIYLLNGALKNGGTITIDGIAGGWGFCITCAAGSGGNNIGKAGTGTLNVINCVYANLNASSGLFQLWPSTGSIGTDVSQNKAKMFLTLNIDNTYIASQATATSNASLGKVNTDAIHITDSVIKTVKTTATNPYGFYICPVTGANNATKHTLSYTCENSYLNTDKAYLFGIYFNGTEKINADTRDGIEIRLTDNIIVNAGLATSDATRATLFTFFNGGKDDPDIAGLIDLIFTGNTVTNTTGAYPKYGYLMYGFGSTMYRTMDISKNTFMGYNNLYRAMPTEYDYSDNIYLDNNGRYISGRSYNNEIAFTDIVLSEDYAKHASDFAVKAGLEVDGGLTWTPGAIDITCNAGHVYKTGLTANEVKEGVTFASDNVQVTGMYEEDGVTAATTLQAGKTYRLVATYKDTPDTVSVVYYVTIDEDPASIPLYTGNRQYLDPAVATLTAGSRVVREVNGVKYQFTVGKNVLGSLSEFPLLDSTDLNGNAAPQRVVYLFAKEYITTDLNKVGGSTKRGMVTHFYGAQAGVSAVTTGSDGIPTGANTARQDPAKETIFRDVTMVTSHQSCVTIDGVMFAGKTYMDDTSLSYGNRVTAFAINNCTTHPDAPIYNTGKYTKIFGFNAGNKSNITMLNNYFVTTEDMPAGYLYVGRNIQELEFANNVFIPGNADIGALFLSICDESGTYDAATDGMEISVHDNLLGGHVNLDSVKAQNAITNNLKIDVLVQNNRFDLENGTRGFFVQNYTGSDTYGYANFAGTSIEVLDNEFCGGAETDDFVRVEGTRTEGVDNVPFKVFRIAGNTFQHSVDAPVKYAIANFSDTVLDVSQNTFVGFAYNYGDADYMVGSAAADKVVVNASKFAPDLTEENVLFTGVSKATFTIDSTDYASDTDNSATVTVADTASSGLKVVDGTTITDVAVAGAKKNGYLFKPASGMMVKITAGDGTVRYNVLPIDITDKTKAKATFTAQLCTIDGKAVGDEFTVTAYADPISVVMNAANCKVSDTADGQKSLYWEANFKGNHSTYIADLISKSGFTIVEYGMYYANDEIAVSDVAILNGGYVDGKYTDGTNILGQKAVYANNPNGLESVYLNYSHSFTAAVPAATEARYGRMYMTYKVGDTLYTVLSDTVTLNIYVAAN